MQHSISHPEGWQADPLDQFQIWFAAMIDAGQPEPYTMQLATADVAGLPSVRTIYLRGDPSQGLTFYTNMHSQKARELDENPQAEAVFYWPQLAQQVRAAGRVTRVSPEQADRAFHQQPHEIQVAAHVNLQQSQPVDLEGLESRLAEMAVKFPAGETVPRPKYWGGFRLEVNRWEFWQGRANGLHDRFAYVLGREGWVIHRLTP
ncbi:Pyridoxal 5'-phosphate synthase (plasmid) [Deinococcus proteolyticus MRP]|uniref:Pyridoxamine 5'-phosphate oxidase n=1 Tax=Deinococcus proteolyticus (strain ATCC 35074 / DSM 20540 / JCM 6276 / NBRC 101906 / NCIMB 13154 / VKM Ac-1939 / CCM 2703 / MRP) TaxID=693977 RepID=F0RR63_DEIPM|nr:pyridoxamine 5'-phosphate oxidase [Deinococcus proteolyticus]ADY27772.1 Pyridoxal 5'-phosphate synthase [Deinococcus proteolyticus MRP]